LILINNKDKVGADVSCLSAPYNDTAKRQGRRSKFQGTETPDFTEERRAGICTVIRQSNIPFHEPSSVSIPLSSAPKSITASFCFCFHLVVAFDPIAELMTKGAVATVFCDVLGVLVSGGEIPVNLSICNAGSLGTSSALAPELELFVGLPSSAV